MQHRTLHPEQIWPRKVHKLPKQEYISSKMIVVGQWSDQQYFSFGFLRDFRAVSSNKGHLQDLKGQSTSTTLENADSGLSHPSPDRL